MNSTWIIDVNVKCKAMKHLGEKNLEDLWDIGLGRVLRLDTKSTVHKRESG